MGTSGQLAIYVESVVPPAEVWIPAGSLEVELREPPVRMQPRRATDRLPPLALSPAACWEQRVCVSGKLVSIRILLVVISFGAVVGELTELPRFSAGRT